MSLIKPGDFIDLYYKTRERGLQFVLDKFTFNRKNSTKSTWSPINYKTSNWWIIPEIRQRLNRLISGDPEITYETFLGDTFLTGKKNLRMLSIGCGRGSHEMTFAKFPNFEHIEGIDLAPEAINFANQKAIENNLKNLSYYTADIYSYDFKPRSYGVILFHASLHHFEKLDRILGHQVKKALKPDGILVLHEYVGPNRFRWKKDQLKEVNRILRDIVPKQYRKRNISSHLKSKVFCPGHLRMILSDPSEAICSENIIPMLKKYYYPLKEVALGGNILHLLLKDIAHNFMNDALETKRLINQLMNLEDEFLSRNNVTTDHLFGIYRIP